MELSRSFRILYHRQQTRPFQSGSRSNLWTPSALSSPIRGSAACSMAKHPKVRPHSTPHCPQSCPQSSMYLLWIARISTLSPSSSSGTGRRWPKRKSRPSSRGMWPRPSLSTPSQRRPRSKQRLNRCEFPGPALSCVLHVLALPVEAISYLNIAFRR